ncbi:type VII secretion target [Actinokineospora iranica]|uniref:Excreted virulence factor EspC, type VII ESX diderm n=1 Tax=Actinokineospora iranica TaxID=1271860 RepID=A0A1G6UDJ2_9PSEU|nr:type VII secretion target [Actinokineospora iranica]SDD38635.1 Excreted virulence factor EspC, type VII ESX diderm [Actinokineospora iranica]
MSGFDIDADQLRWHANTTASIADQLSGVSDRAPDRVADGALGSFTQFLTTGLSDAVGQSGVSIADVSAAVDTMSLAIRRSAEAYERTDEHSASHLAQEYPR